MGILLFLLISSSVWAESIFESNAGTRSILAGDRAVTFESSDVKYLPAGSSTGAILEYWYLSSLTSTQDKGGFAATEPYHVNTHASSSLWQKYWLGMMDISSPDLRGRSFIELPMHLWDSFSVRSLLSNYGDQKGYRWDIKPERHKETLSANLGLASHLGGVSFMAPNTFDREPAQAWGAPEQRRHFLPSYEADALYNFTGFASLPASGFVEFLSHNRSFRSLGDETENNFRITSSFLHRLPNEAEALIMYQGSILEYQGAEEGIRKQNTLETSRHNFLFRYENSKETADSFRYHAGFGLGYKNQRGRDNTLYSSLEEEISYAPLQYPNETTSFFIDSSVRDVPLFHFGRILDTKVNFHSPFRFELVHKEQDLDQFKIIRTAGSAPLDIISFDGSFSQSDMLLRVRPELSSLSKYKNFTIKAGFALLTEALIHQDGVALARLSPSGELLFSYSFKSISSKILFGLQHAPIPLSLEESEFLNPASNRGRRNRWVDTNQDGLFQEDERQENPGVLERFGGLYHSKAASLETPSLEEAYLGWETSFLNVWKGLFQVSGKWHRNLYWVGYNTNGTFNPTFTQIDRSDVHGGALYERTPSSYGKELYLLTNREKDSFYLAFEIQIFKSAENSWWFINVSFGGYIHLAHNLSGNGIYNNDIGRYAEKSADPNHNLALLGRTDYDRGYMINILFGFYLWEGLTLTNVIRYRDGTPYGDFVLVRGLSQGTTAVMDEERARGLEGIGRYTFYLNWDVRLRYEWSPLVFTFDIYNFLESSTETNENPFRGESFRRPIESASPRSFRFKVGYKL